MMVVVMVVEVLGLQTVQLLRLFIPICDFIIIALLLLVGPWPLFQFQFHLVGLFGWGMSWSQGCYPHTAQHKHKINTYRHLCLEWNSTPLPQYLSAQRGHASDHAATAISCLGFCLHIEFC
jgi:hypothetical protein